MKIEDLIQLLNNRLREFKLSQNYATMSGDLERVIAADKEIIALEDTLFKLNLLVDASKSAAVKEATVAEVVTDGSVAVLGEYDITPYATDPLHEEKVMNILSRMGIMNTAEQVDNYIKGKYLSSPVTGEMVISAATAYTVDARLMMAIMEQDSRFGTVGLAVSTTNPGNVGNDDDGNTRTYDSWQDGVTAVAEWLNRHRVIEGALIPEPELTPIPTETSTTTPFSMGTTTPFTTSTTTPFSTGTTTPIFIATSTPISMGTTTPISISTTTSTTTPFSTGTTTPFTTSTTTPLSTGTTTPISMGTTTPISISTTTSTTTPMSTATSTPISISTTTSTTTPMSTATSTPTLNPDLILEPEPTPA